ncbi:hypothetical protein Tsubulata_013524 [Turnera subulata]|uniref:Uncharacterized protein n=1 Tax=Turnera subulata TaxID=218843 RepID=A0A9Q0JM05_9ROSI|nr:hypothetical protein Tsubulata_013524 [Turnera subulata]
MGNPFVNMQPPAFIEDQAPEPRKSRGPIIEELDSDEEKEEAEKAKNENPRKHARLSKEPYVEDPDDEEEAQERRSKQLQRGSDYNRFGNSGQQPQSHSFTFQSSTFTYGGANGAYYTSSKTRRTGSDGLTLEESKEADSSTGKASHRVSRGLHNKGHTLTRNLDSDGRVNSMQTLHNINEDELSGFEEAWKGKAKQHLPGWSGSLLGHDNMGPSVSAQNAQAGRGGWALPSTDRPRQHPEMMVQDAAARGGGSSRSHQSERMKSSLHSRDKTGNSRWKARD